MKHFSQLILVALLFSLGGAAYAQPGERIEQLRIAFLTEELDLTSQEGQAFWPLFNEYNDQRKDFESSARRAERELDRKASPSEADVLEVAKLQAENLRKQADLLDDYLPKFLEVLGPERTVRLMRSEEEFKRRMLERIRDRRRP